MKDYLLISTALSFSIFMALALLRSAPPRVRLWVCLLGLTVWLVPWSLIINLLEQSPATGIVWLSTSNIVRETATNIPDLPTPINWFWIFWMLNSIGVLVFVIRCLRHAQQLAAYRKRALPQPGLLQQHGFVDEIVPVYVVSEFTNAFVSGYFNQAIWLGKMYLGSPSIRSVLQHELTHVSSHDNLYLLFIAVLKDLFWWNPLIRMLAKYANQNIELDCDFKCQNRNPEYRSQIAFELLHAKTASTPTELVTAFIWKKKFNLYRIRQLEKNCSMKKLHIVPVMFVATVGVLALALSATEEQKSVKGILTSLNVVTEYGEYLDRHGNHTSKNEIRTEFYGEEEVVELLRAAKSASMSVQVEMPHNNHRVISIRSTNIDATRILMKPIMGNEYVEAGFSPTLTNDQATKGDPILIDLTLEIDKQSIFKGTLAANDSHWTGLTSGEYMIRIMPSRIRGGITLDEQDTVLVEAEISEQVNGIYQVIARPSFINKFDKDGLMQFQDNEHDFSIGLVARQVN